MVMYEAQLPADCRSRNLRSRRRWCDGNSYFLGVKASHLPARFKLQQMLSCFSWRVLDTHKAFLAQPPL